MLFFTRVYLITIISLSCYARWQSKEEAAVLVEKLYVQTNIKKDQSFSIIRDSSLKIIRDEGRSDYGTRVLSYWPNMESYKVISASVVNDEKEFPVDSKFIVETDPSANKIGFDSKKNITISYPGVKLGSILKIKTELKSKNTSSLIGSASKNIFFDGKIHKKGNEYHFVSYQPLYFEINDPQKKLEFTEIRDVDQNYIYKIIVKADIYEDVSNENFAFVPQNKLTWFAYSVDSDYKNYFSKVINRFEKIDEESLPDFFQSIVEQARSKVTEIDKINFVTSELSKQIRYMGDWREINSGFAPHSFKFIAEHKIADCKDFSIVINKILRLLGLKSYVALVTRGLRPVLLPKVPVAAEFNHAIVMVESDNGKKFWIDGTNYESFAEGIPIDISDRQAFILDSKKAHLELIPSGGANDNVSSIYKRITLAESGIANGVINASYSGLLASPWVLNVRKESREQTENQILQKLFPTRSNLLKYKFEKYNFPERIVKEVSYQIVSTEILSTKKTSNGKAYSYEPPLALNELFKIDRFTRVSDFIFPYPITQRSVVKLDGIDVVGRKIKNCSAQFAGIIYSFKVHYQKKSLELESNLTVNNRFIPAELIQKTEFENFLKELKTCMGEALFVYRNK